MKSTTENPSQDTMKNSNGATLKLKYDAEITLRDLLVAGLMDMYWAEKALSKVIPEMVKNATSGDLADDLDVHLEETVDQVTKLEEVFTLLREKPIARKCVAMEGLINEAELIMKETEEGAVRDAGIIAAAQKIEHYEIASYGALANFAKSLGENDAAFILLEIMAEEMEVEEALTQLAKVSINNEANSTDDDRNEYELDENELDENDQDNNELDNNELDENELDENDQEEDLDEEADLA